MKTNRRDVVVGVITKAFFFAVVAAAIIVTFSSCSRGYGCPNAF